MEAVLKEASPLITINSPFEIYQQAPCNLIFETELIIFYFICTYHAFANINKNRIYLISWITTIISGLCLDIFTIYSPEIGNFYQHKFTIMLLNNHEPFYIFFGLYYVSHLPINNLIYWALIFNFGVGIILIHYLKIEMVEFQLLRHFGLQHIVQEYL